MSTFSKLSAVAQYDDMIRTLNKIVLDGLAEEEAQDSYLENLDKLWNKRESEYEREKRALKNEITSLQKDIKKLNRQLTESRSALVRESEEKKLVLREKKALLDQIRQVRQLVEKESYGDTDAHRRRVIKCLDVDRLSPIQSDDSDDCVSGLDYDRTEDDLLDIDPPPPKSSRRSALYDDALEDLNPTEQPTLPLYRFADKNTDNRTEDRFEEPRRSLRSAVKRHSNTQSSSNPPTSATTSSNSNPAEKIADLNIETDTNTYETDDNDIEFVRQQLKKYEAENKQKLAAVNSTPNLKDRQKKGMTLSARSAASLMKSISSVNTPVANTLKPHSFVSKKCFKPETCGPCGGRVGFYQHCVKCEVCGVVSHPDCKEKCPLPCVKITAPNTRSSQRRILISDYVIGDAVPKVPALIVHCCNEIEKGDNINTTGLYRVVSHTKEIEDLQQKILKSKSGMPNLSKFDVHLLTGVVKRFLQGLDESLITTTLWSYFAEAIKLDSDNDARTQISYYISQDMPPANRDTLSFLMQHLHAIAKHSDKNMMTTKALAKTLAPTIIGNSCRNPQTSTVQNETKIQIQIMETLFSVEEEFWSNFVQRMHPSESQPATSLGSRLLSDTPTDGKTTRSRASRLGGTLPTPKLKPLFS